MTVSRESPWYQEIEQKGIQIGEQRGKQSAIPVLAEVGFSAAEIAQRLDLPLDLVQATLGSVPNP